ncbi:hypothetical protein DL96DRAFT_1712149 [Flagelloscypha sp. PMI_526]|nr:hypothetical protein DL96DRAFT_1712149 [Flagelloscypha sp. PMI_526]
MAFEALPIPNVLLPFAPQYTTLLKPLSTIPEYPIPVFSKPAWRPASVHLLGPKLPDALATLIIHHLRGDQASLRALSLTHKAVLPAVHKLLFQNILFTPSSGLMAQMDFPRPYNTPDLLERLVIVEGNANDGTDWIEYRKPDPPNPFLKFSLFVPPTCNSHDFNEALKFMARGCKGLKSLELRMDPPPSGKSLSWGPPISPQDNSSYGPPQKRTCIVWSSLDEREREALLGLFRVPVTYMVILEWNFHFHSLVDWFHFLKSCVNWRGSVTMTWPTVSGWGEPMLEGLPKHIWDIIVAEIVENNPQRLTPLLISSPKLSRLARASLFRTLTVDSESRCPPNS